ncbi:hypothetical protein F2Q69_00052492 [Brassica cretica]|uniref:Uncharacterized protein n=1 Tax=Brassica cretica TaxID=69181 RepID=A0A8S9MXR0_BRACR|nr:hypothetical protein F2Q69_00052492 [Brassica cretica]
MYLCSDESLSNFCGLLIMGLSLNKNIYFTQFDQPLLTIGNCNRYDDGRWGFVVDLICCSKLIDGNELLLNPKSGRPGELVNCSFRGDDDARLGLRFFFGFSCLVDGLYLFGRAESNLGPWQICVQMKGPDTQDDKVCSDCGKPWPFGGVTKEEAVEAALNDGEEETDTQATVLSSKKRKNRSQRDSAENVC